MTVYTSKYTEKYFIVVIAGLSVITTKREMKHIQFPNGHKSAISRLTAKRTQ